MITEKKPASQKTTQIIITEFKNITWELARLEGENNNLSEWQASHQNFFALINPDFNHETKVVFEIFEVIKI
ncbi:MAG: ASCH domain-containing protein [Lachnospiraceae bacterium]|nr:ASCH domain-containing protein [Lachnospiraceae bacterium]